MYSLDISMAGTARENVRGWLRKNASTKITGTQAHSYMRGSDAAQDGALTWIGIVELAASDAIDVRWDCPTNQTITAAAGAYLHMWEIPASADEIIVEATTGDYNADADFAWDTELYSGTGFSYTTGNTNITSHQNSYNLIFATFSQLVDSTPQRAYPEVQININDNILPSTAGGGYHRNSSTYGFAVTVAGIGVVASGSTIEIHTKPIGAAGALANIAGQFSILDLESIWDYTYEPIIISSDTQVDLLETNIIVNGANFIDSPSGILYIADSTNFASATKVEQSIDSWTDTQIQYDFVQGALLEGLNYLFVYTNSSGISNAYQVNIGQTSYDEVINNLSPDNYWTLQNTYNDSGAGSNDVPMTTDIVNSGGYFVTSPLLSRTSTYSWEIDNILTRRGCADNDDMNLDTHTERTMGGWIQLGDIQQSLSALYKEGGSVNNLAFLTGYGNVLMAQLADTGDDNVQAYSDFKLATGRSYHIMFRFSYDETPKEFRLFIDGVQQSVTDGNPLTSTNLDSHNGDINWGDPDATLEMGGTNVAFAGKTKAQYAYWCTWSKALDKETEIRYKLFELGAKENTIIQSQSDMDEYSGTTIADCPLAFKIYPSASAITMDNITFDDRVSIELQWTAETELVVTLINGTVLDTDKISKIFTGSTVTIISPPLLTLTGLQTNTEVRIYESGTTNEVSGIESTSGTYSDTIYVDYVDIQIVSINYKIVRYNAVDLTGGDVSLPIDQELDRTYFNP